MIVQRISAGWALFGVAVFAALALTLAHVALVRVDRTAFKLALATFVCIGLTQAIFWTSTYPMNAATQNWTVLPANFEGARRQWEHSHAGSAVLTFAACVAVALSAVGSKRDDAD